MEKYYKAFLSHTAKDKTIADQICALLERSGIPCWIAPRDIEPGADWAQQIVEGIESCESFILILSRHSMDSNEVQKEVTLATATKKKVLTFCLDDSEPTGSFRYHLSVSQWIRVKDGNLAAAVKDLQYALTGNGRERSVYMKAETPESGWSAEADSLGRNSERGWKKVRSRNSVVNSGKSGRQPGKAIRITTYRELIECGLTKQEIAGRLVENDKKLYPHIDAENEGDATQWEAYLSSYPQTFRYLVNEENEIIGNWSFVILSAEDYRRAEAGLMTESELDVRNTAFFMFGGVYYGYLLNFSINREYMSTDNFRLLFDSFLEQLETSAENGIYFRKWCVNVFLPEHERMYEDWGFQFVRDNKKSGRMYTLSFDPYPEKRVFRRRTKLRKLYVQKFRVECRQLDAEEELDIEEAEEIAGLIYDTDPHIYPAMFGTRERALDLIPDLMEEEDPMFCRENLFVAEQGGRIVGMILWKPGPLFWSKELFADLSEKLGIPVSPYLDLVEEGYMQSYSAAERKDRISLINFCIAEDCRNMGIGDKLMGSFLKAYGGADMELCVLKDNEAAVRLYRSHGFVVTEEYQGFSVAEPKPGCFTMIRKAYQE